jgi:hypothetical protein
MVLGAACLTGLSQSNDPDANGTKIGAPGSDSRVAVAPAEPAPGDGGGPLRVPPL